jgi:hypothetical protein
LAVAVAVLEAQTLLAFQEVLAAAEQSFIVVVQA